MSKWSLLGLIGTLLPFAATATMIDFSDPSYSAIEGALNLERVITVEAYEPWDNGTYNITMDIDSKTPMDWLGEEGIGTTGQASEYIDGYEWVTFTFDNDVFIGDVLLSDFFAENLPKSVGGNYSEIGWYIIDGRWQEISYFDAGGNISNPFILSVADTVREIQFGAKGNWMNLNEFGIVGMDAYKVPEAKVFPMLSMGLVCIVGLFLSSRRKRI
jgi:hypothetical protein